MAEMGFAVSGAGIKLSRGGTGQDGAGLMVREGLQWVWLEPGCRGSLSRVDSTVGMPKKQV